MSDDAQLAQRTPTSVRDFLALPAYKARFAEVLGQRAPQFMASLIQLTNDPYLARCEPKSVIASAMIAAILDFPIEKSLGFAHIVPYGGVAQFQMAAKGYVQLALRSGQYQRLNAKPVNAEAFGGYDEIGEPKIDWSELDETKPTVGYVVAWRLTNGFTKVAYWPKNKVENHAAQFSQAYKKKKMDSPWFTNFDKMALKTVVMNELRAWGVLSVQMQTALKHDMGAQKDVEAEVEYVDGTTEEATEANATVEAARPPPPPRARKGAAAVAENPAPVAPTIDVVTTAPVKPEPVTVTQSASPVPVAAPTEKEKLHTQVTKTLADSDAWAKNNQAEKAVEDPNSIPAHIVPVMLKPNESRDSLNVDEAVIVDCSVISAQTLIGTYRGKTDVPMVSAQLTGGFRGNVRHPYGAVLKADKTLELLPEWQGKKVRVTLFGAETTTKKIVVRVVKCVALSGAAPTTAPEATEAF